MENRHKYRVWNELKQEFEPETRVHLLGNGELVLIDECGRTNVEGNPNYKISFCTGIKDKNNNLIYESDIVEQNGRQYIVNWEYGSFCFKDINTNKNFTVEFVEPERQKVIGNIYENPNMLEENKRG